MSMTPVGEDSDSNVEGYDPEDGKWVTVNKTKKKQKRKGAPRAKRKNEQGIKDRSEGENMDDEEQGMHNNIQLQDVAKSERNGDKICKNGEGDKICKQVPKQVVNEEPIADNDSVVFCLNCGVSFHASCQGLTKSPLLALRRYMLCFLCSLCKENSSQNGTNQGRRKREGGQEGSCPPPQPRSWGGQTYHFAPRNLERATRKSSIENAGNNITPRRSL